jgi:hypothetical protein
MRSTVDRAGTAVGSTRGAIDPMQKRPSKTIATPNIDKSLRSSCQSSDLGR